MKVRLIVVGKTDEKYLIQGIKKYEDRLKHYVKFSLEVIPDVKRGKKTNVSQLQLDEGKAILSKVKSNEFLVLLDERGQEFNSVQFAKFFEKKMVGGVNSMVFVVGGAFGFSQEMYDRANSKISLSQMTFSHQMIRLFFVEQIYRAFTIIKGEKYHNDGGLE